MFVASAHGVAAPAVCVIACDIVPHTWPACLPSVYLRMCVIYQLSTIQAAAGALAMCPKHQLSKTWSTPHQSTTAGKKSHCWFGY